MGTVLSGAPVCSGMGCSRYTVRLRAVVTLENTPLSPWAGLAGTTCTLELKGAALPNLGFSSLCRKDKKGCWRGEEKDVLWNELGQGGDPESREAALETTEYRWSEAEVRNFDLGCTNAVAEMKHQDTWHRKES